MDIEKIEKFIDAGYTKEEINSMLSVGKPEGVQTKDENGGESTKPEESEGHGAPEQAHDSALEITATLQALTTTVKGLQDTVKAIQAANSEKAKTESPKADDEIKSIMDSFINTL